MIMSSKKHVFTLIEKKLFVEILKKFSSVIEDKNTDGATLRAKNEAWETLTNQFNASPYATTQVSAKQLRRLWMNLKQRQKDALTRERRRQVQRVALARERQYSSISDAVIDPLSQVSVGYQDTGDSDTIQDATANIKSEDTFEDSQPYSEPSTTPFFIPSTSVTTPSITVSKHGPNAFVENEYFEKERRANEIHELELVLLREKIREAKAKADLAEKLLRSAGASTASGDQ